MTENSKKALYESIMNDVAKIVKRRIVEAANAAEKKIVVFTGKSKYFEGDKVEKFIEKNTDFKTSHTVNDKTYMIITGEKPGPKKIKYAEENGIVVMPEDKFFSKYGLKDELPEPLNEFFGFGNSNKEDAVFQKKYQFYKNEIIKNFKDAATSQSRQQKNFGKPSQNDPYFKAKQLGKEAIEKGYIDKSEFDEWHDTYYVKLRSKFLGK